MGYKTSNINRIAHEGALFTDWYGPQSCTCIEEGTKVSVKYTEKGGEKTALGVKAAGKATAKAVE
jgi:hypothetical protein